MLLTEGLGFNVYEHFKSATQASSANASSHGSTQLTCRTAVMRKQVLLAQGRPNEHTT
jgi:hypothetical protein